MRNFMDLLVNLTKNRKYCNLFQDISNKCGAFFIMEDDILTIEEVAKYLRVSDRTVYDWAQKGEIPAGKIGTVWRFKKSELEKWVNERLSSSSVKKSESEVQIKNFLSPDRVVFIKNSSKRDTIDRYKLLSNF